MQTEVDLRFYEVAAQVLPVLALVVVVEFRNIRDDVGLAADLSAIGTVLFMAAGEFCSLDTLLSRSGSQDQRAVVIAALWVAGGWLVLTMVRPQLDRTLSLIFKPVPQRYKDIGANVLYAAIIVVAIAMIVS